MRTLREQLLDEPIDRLRSARVHEAEGRGRVGFALFQAVRFSGPIFWVALAHDRDRLMPISLPDGVAERLHLIEAPSETDLWTVEKKLRVKSVGLIIAEPEKPMSLTAGRRLQLAAEAGQTTGLMMMMEGRGEQCRRDPLEM